VSGSGISWAICKSAPRSRQITTPAPHHSFFYRPDALPAAQPTASKHWRLTHNTLTESKIRIFWWLDVSNSGAHICMRHSLGFEARFLDSKSLSTWRLPSSQQHSANGAWRPALSVLATSRLHFTSRLVKLSVFIAVLPLSNCGPRYTICDLFIVHTTTTTTTV